MITIGSRVVLTEYARSIGINAKFPCDRQGTITGAAQFPALNAASRMIESARAWLVLWDGNSTPIKITKFLVELAPSSDDPIAKARQEIADGARPRDNRFRLSPDAAADDYLKNLESEAAELLSRGKSR